MPARQRRFWTRRLPPRAQAKPCSTRCLQRAALPCVGLARHPDCGTQNSQSLPGKSAGLFHSFRCSVLEERMLYGGRDRKGYGGGGEFQLIPPSVVAKAEPSREVTSAEDSPVAVTSRRSALVGLRTGAQVLPPSVVRSTVPDWPTAQPSEASKNATL